MKVLGIGSNLGDRFAYLRRAIFYLRQQPEISVQAIAPVYQSDALLPEGAPASWNQAYLNSAVLIKTSLSAEAILPLLKKIERQVGLDPEKKHWGPRQIDIDILTWDQEIINQDHLQIPHAGLLERPFALWPLADIAPDWRYPVAGDDEGKSAQQLATRWQDADPASYFNTQVLTQTAQLPELVGVLNVTPDSCSDGGLYLAPEAALQQAQVLYAAGASIIDIGAESTRPNGTPVSPEEEWQRLAPVLDSIYSLWQDPLARPKISIDTRRASVAEKAIAMGVDIINDVSGCDDPAMLDLLAQNKQDVIIMHHLSLPVVKGEYVPEDQDIIEVVHTWAKNKLQTLFNAGINKERIVLDAGIGFGKSAKQSLRLIQNIDAFYDLGVRILVGHSRKRFLNLFTDKDYAERDIETFAVSNYLAGKGVDYLRVHDVAGNLRSIKVADGLLAF